MTARYLGWDIGGAHLKFAALAADGALLDLREIACPLWEGPDRLSAAIAALAGEIDFASGVHAISMTGEMCDAFTSRAHGVAAILDVLARHLGGTSQVYGAGRWYSPEEARHEFAEVASMNWHATARYVAGCIGDAFLVDIGSTTTDLIPLQDRAVISRGTTDAERLTHGELVYTGIARTPVMAVARRLPLRGEWRGVAAEHFANMADVYRITGELPVAADLYPTADRRPADRLHSLRRLARMLGTDADREDEAALVECARFIRFRQLVEINAAMTLSASRAEVATASATVVGAGVGHFLAARLASLRGAHFLDFSAVAGVPPRFASLANAAAPALALARLAAESFR